MRSKLEVIDIVVVFSMHGGRLVAVDAARSAWFDRAVDTGLLDCIIARHLDRLQSVQDRVLVLRLR